jgi:hypothetical protein
MRRHGICDGRCVARRLGPVGMIRLCACGVPASAHCFTAWNTATQATLHQKLKQMIEKEHRRAQILRQVGRYLQSTGVLQYAEIREYPRAPQHRNARRLGNRPPRTSSYLLVYWSHVDAYMHAQSRAPHRDTAEFTARFPLVSTSRYSRSSRARCPFTSERHLQPGTCERRECGQGKSALTSDERVAVSASRVQLSHLIHLIMFKVNRTST